MNKARFSAFRSLLNSWHYNGFFITAKFLFSLILIKLNFKKSISFHNNKLFLRNGSSDLPAFRQVFMDYEYLLNIEKKAIKTIIDGGCNIALASIYFASQFPNAMIAGIEPDSKNFEQAVLNTRHLKNVKLFKAGIWNKNCFLETKSEPNLGEWGITVRETDQAKSNTIKAMTIDTIMFENNFQTIDILKLDIEGAEFEVFQSGFQSWLPKTRIIMIELHDFMKKNCSLNFFNAIAEAGINYSMAIRDENIIIFNNSFNLQ
jgi:FkbM family methyltransferase